MSWGVKITNPEGVTLIDGTSWMPFLWYETTVSLYTPDHWTEAYTDIAFPGLSQKPLVLVSPLSHHSYWAGYPWKSSSLWDRARIKRAPCPSGVTVDAKVFVFAMGGADWVSGTYGIRFIGPAGDVIFDGSKKTIRLKEQHDFSLNGGASITYSFPDLGYIPPIGWATRTCYSANLYCDMVGIFGVGVKVATSFVEVKNIYLGGYGPGAKAVPCSTTGGTVDGRLFIYEYA